MDNVAASERARRRGGQPAADLRDAPAPGRSVPAGHAPRKDRGSAGRGPDRTLRRGRRDAAVSSHVCFAFTATDQRLAAPAERLQELS